MSETDIHGIQARLEAFARERDWEQFHTPKNLAMALAGEAGELLEVFQWSTPQDSVAPSPEVRARAAEEIADVINYALRLCSVLELDPVRICAEKIEVNARRYPAERVRGSSAKYTDYD